LFGLKTEQNFEDRTGKERAEAQNRRHTRKKEEGGRYDGGDANLD